MAFINVCYPNGNMFDISNASLHTEEIETSLREEWNFPKYVTKLSDMKSYQSIDEIPLTNRFSCLSNMLQKEMERCVSPPLTKCGQQITLTIKTKTTTRNSKLARHKSMSELDVKEMKEKNRVENARNAKVTRHKSMVELNEKPVKRRNNLANTQTSQIPRHKSMTDLNTSKPSRRKTTAEKSRNVKLSRNKSMTELRSKERNEIDELSTGKLARNKYIPEHTKSVESLIDDENTTSLKSAKSPRKPRKRKNRKDMTNLNMQKSKSTSDLSDLKDDDALFNDQAYTDFSAMLKSVKQTLQEIIDASNKENITEPKESNKGSPKVTGEIPKKKVQSKTPKSEKLNSNHHKLSPAPQAEPLTERKSNLPPHSLKKGTPMIGSKIPSAIPSSNKGKSIPVEARKDNKEKTLPSPLLKEKPLPSSLLKEKTLPTPLLKEKHKDSSNVKSTLVSKGTQAVPKKTSLSSQTEQKVKSLQCVGTQTSKDTVLASAETQTEEKQVSSLSVDTQTVSEVMSLLSTETQTDTEHTPQNSVETQTEDILTVIVSSDTYANNKDSKSDSSSNGENSSGENSCGEEEAVSDGNDEGISEGDSDTNDEATSEDAPTVAVTPSRWLASMGMHKLCIFSNKDTARIKSYDYFLPQIHDFDPNVVVVHVGMSEYAMCKDGKDEETPSVGEAVMKVVEICSDYGVKDVVVCNVKNRSTSAIRERRAKLAECLVPLCKKEGVRFKYNNKLYKQQLPPTAVKLTVPDQWLCMECKSDQPWNSEDRKRVREEVLKCYDQISVLESNFKDAEKEIKILRNIIKNATEDKESTDVKHKREILDLRLIVDEKTKEIDLLRRNLKFR